jgi:hypothetical protein
MTADQSAVLRQSATDHDLRHCLNGIALTFKSVAA